MAATVGTFGEERNLLEMQQCVPLVKVSKAEIDKLVTEIMQVKEFLPKVLNSAELLNVYNRLDVCEKELEACQEKKQKLKMELDQLRMKHDVDLHLLRERNNNLLGDCEKHKEEKYDLKCQLSESIQQLCDQSEYCSSMGAAVCTLLWSVSRQQESVTSLLAGNKAEDFLQLTSRTIESYFETYSDDNEKEKSDEFQFVLALIGTVTNMAAAAEGRDFLVSKESGRTFIHSFMTVLGVCGIGNNVKIRNLILMALYNISINLSGLQHIMKKQGMMDILMKIIHGESDSELRLNAARLFQSVVMEPNTLPHEAFQSISFPALQNLARTSKGELRDILFEVLSDLQSWTERD